MSKKALLLSVFACGLFAQNAQLNGLVQDQTGSPIPGVAIRLTQEGTGLKRDVQTNDQGAYAIPSLAPGAYEISASMSGMETSSVRGLKVDTAQQARLDFTLKPASVSTTVDIVAAAAVLNTSDATVKSTIAREVTENLPLNGRRYSDLALLVPGVRKSALMRGGNFSDREGSFNVNGMPSSYNNFVLDGVDNNAYGTSNRGYSNQVIQPSPDAIEEFTVQTNTMSAEFGRAAGGNISASFRSGSNRIHGNLYEYLRNTTFNATGFFKPVGNVKPTLNRNQFGATISGPIWKNRTFFFADYESLREVRRNVATYTVPTLEMRQGNLGAPILNPLTNEVYADGRIPERAMQPFGKWAASLWPAPNLPGVANNWTTLLYSNDKTDKGDVKVDHRFNDRYSAFMRYSSSKRDIYSPTYPSEAADPGEGRNYILLYQGLGAMTAVLSPRTVAEARFSYSFTKAGKQPLTVGGPGLQALFGIPGLPTTPDLTGGLNTQSVTGWSALGRQSTNPQYQDPQVWNLRPSITHLLGRHSLKAGYEFQAINVEVQDSNPLYGIDTYAGQFSRPAGGTALPATYGLADLLMGNRSRYQLTNYQVSQVRQRMHFFYLQDDYRFSDKLTLNIGARYEFATPQYEQQNRLANFNLQTLKLQSASDGSIRNRTGVNPDWNNVAPRIGLAYQVNPSTVIRTGYGISYMHNNRRGGTMTVFNPPFSLGSTVDQRPTDPGFRSTMAGYPEGFTAPATFDPRVTGVKAFDLSGKTPYVQNWTISLQRKFGQSWVIEAAYIGNHGVAFPVGYDINNPLPNKLGQDLPILTRRPYVGFSSILAVLPVGASTYSGVQMKVERRFTRGFQLMNSLTLSKTMDNYCAPMEEGNNCGLQNPNYDRASDWAVSTLHQAFNNVTSMVYELPFGKGRQFGKNMGRALDAVAGGWRFTAISTIETGEPVNLTWSPAVRFNVGGTPRPNLSGDLMTPSAARQPNDWLNKAAVSLPADYTNPYGNAARNVGRSPSQFNADIGLHKKWAVLPEVLSLEFRGEAFNILNHTNFRAPNANASNANYGTITSSYPARILQFALRLGW